MAKGQHFTPYQQGIVKRYYEHYDTLQAQKLGELVSELYLCGDKRKLAKLWESARQSLTKVGADEARIRRIVGAQNVEELARLVGEMAAGAKVGPGPSSSSAPGSGTSAPGAPPAMTPPSPTAGTSHGAPDSAPGTSPAPMPTTEPPSVPAPAGTAAAGSGTATGPTSAASSGVAPPSPEVLKSALKAFRKRLKLTRLDDESRLSVRPMTSGKKSSIVAIMPPSDFPRTVWEELARQGKIKHTGRGFYELVGE